MTLRFLIGPVTAAFADQYLEVHRKQGRCLAFHPLEPVDLAIRSGDDWDDVQARLPVGWQPDLLVLNLLYNAVPQGRMIDALKESSVTASPFAFGPTTSRRCSISALSSPI